MNKNEPILDVRGISKAYKRANGRFTAVRDVSFTLSASEILGIVGESGCGKSTLASCISRLVSPDSGEIIWRDRDISKLGEKEMRSIRPHIQMIFQNPYASFNPVFTVGKALSRVGRFYKMPPQEYSKRLEELINCCGIDKELLDRHPSQLSGGQLQRLAIVRALLPSPKLLIADEAVSALDVSVQEPILELLRSLRDRYGIAIIFISHDLAVVKSLCRRVLVMYKGSIVEEGDTCEIYNFPAHPYTKALLSARPRLDQSKKAEERILLSGDVGSSGQDEDGCPFAGRCYLDKVSGCTCRRPDMTRLSDSHRAACFHIKDGEEKRV